MSRKLFGTDGIRGTVGQHPITPDVVLRLGHAVGRVLKAREPNPTVPRMPSVPNNFRLMCLLLLRQKLRF